jgi:hypothetical protein
MVTRPMANFNRGQKIGVKPNRNSARPTHTPAWRLDSSAPGSRAESFCAAPRVVLEKLKLLMDGQTDQLNTGFDHASLRQLFGKSPSRSKAEQRMDLAKQLAAVKAACAKLKERGADES